MRVPISVEPQEEGRFLITSPLVPELITEADTVDEIWPHFMDAWETVVELYEALGRSPPSELYMSDAMTGPIVLDALIPA